MTKIDGAGFERIAYSLVRQVMTIDWVTLGQVIQPR